MNRIVQCRVSAQYATGTFPFGREVSSTTSSSPVLLHVFRSSSLSDTYKQQDASPERPRAPQILSKHTKQRMPQRRKVMAVANTTKSQEIIKASKASSYKSRYKRVAQLASYPGLASACCLRAASTPFFVVYVRY